MPLDRLVLIVVAVFAAAAVTVWVGTLLVASAALPGALLAVLPVLALLAYIVVRVIRDRMTNAEDDHYDRIDR